MTMSDNAAAVEMLPVPEMPVEEPALVAEASPPSPPPPPPPPTGPKKLTTEERYEIENCFLKVQNIALQTEKLYSDVQKAVTMRQEEQARMVAIQARLGAKYNVDMATVKIAPDGTIIELNAQKE